MTAMAATEWRVWAITIIMVPEQPVLSVTVHLIGGAAARASGHIEEWFTQEAHGPGRVRCRCMEVFRQAAFGTEFAPALARAIRVAVLGRVLIVGVSRSGLLTTVKVRLVCCAIASVTERSVTGRQSVDLRGTLTVGWFGRPDVGVWRCAAGRHRPR